MFSKAHLLASAGPDGSAEAILATQLISLESATTLAWNERWLRLYATVGSSQEAEPRAATSLCAS